jgi:HEAT repeat protein
MRETKPALVCDMLYAMAHKDAMATDAQDKRVLAMALRRVAKPPILQAVARQLPRTPDRQEELMAVLGRMGEDGADALIEQIATASQQSDRRVYFDALLHLQSGIPTLVHMLGDTRWFVARNAADLLGEMQAKEAEQPLTWLLQHDDDRVRRSATTALMRLGTPRALQAIHDTLKDGVPQMRIQAATALVARQDVRTASALLRALDTEKDEAVQEAFLLALGRLGTPDAVQRLVATAEPEKGFFKNKRTALRLAAVQGLAESRSREALAGLTALTSDKDAEVRDAATFALGRMQRVTSNE